MWEPRRLTTLWASTACYRDSFTFFYLTDFVLKRAWICLCIHLTEDKASYRLWRPSAAKCLYSRLLFPTLIYGRLQILVGGIFRCVLSQPENIIANFTTMNLALVNEWWGRERGVFVVGRCALQTRAGGIRVARPTSFEGCYVWQLKRC
jgi:hypothetical protein